MQQAQVFEQVFPGRTHGVAFRGHGQGRPDFRCLLRVAGLVLGLTVAYPPAALSDCGVAAPHAPSNAARPAKALKRAPLHHFDIVARYPHDRSAFTQGLVFHGNDLFESTGIHGHSGVRRLDLQTGEVLNEQRLAKAYFGEGLTVVNDQLVQLTWRAGAAFIYNPADLSRTGDFSFAGEGWGSATVGDSLVISDGSSWLRFFDTGDYHQTGTVQVTDRGRPVAGLNELERVNKLIYANVYPGDCIAMIEPTSGQVAGWLDLGGLMPLSERPDGSAVANGIAYNRQTGELFVTGKFWPHIYQLKLLDKVVLPDKRAAASGDTSGRPQK